MFIKRDTLVEFIAGKHAGKRGRVADIVLDETNFMPCVLVSVWLEELGNFCNVLAFAGEIQRRPADDFELLKQIKSEMVAADIFQQAEPMRAAA